ncbi:CAP domain-containing protein [Streptomonospora sp. PA3]|uniref:CAP domain-containing protein n=1 Tax=Streptomonospora sp. PA3 TaxID=2607326 RepID=UPI0031BAA30F
MGALAAVPVGLGLAAALIVAAGPPPSNPLVQNPQAGADSAPGAADEALPPAPDDFFPSPEDGGSPQGQQDGSGAGGGAGGAGEPSAPAGPPDAVAEGAATLAPSQRPEEDGQDGSGSDAGSQEPGGSEDGSAGSSGGGAEPSAAARQVVALANEERADAGCPPLSVDPRLTAASEAHSRDMAARDYMAHESPEGEGPAERAEEAGYHAWSGENVAAGYTSPEAVMEGWMNSPGHRANILNCANTEVGVAETDTKWAQNFGTG